MIKISTCQNNRREKTKNNYDAFRFGFWEETAIICYSVKKCCYCEIIYKCN